MNQLALLANSLPLLLLKQPSLEHQVVSTNLAQQAALTLRPNPRYLRKAHPPNESNLPINDFVLYSYLSPNILTRVLQLEPCQGPPMQCTRGLKKQGPCDQERGRGCMLFVTLVQTENQVQSPTKMVRGVLGASQVTFHHLRAWHGVSGGLPRFFLTCHVLPSHVITEFICMYGPFAL